MTVVDRSLAEVPPGHRLPFDSLRDHRELDLKLHSVYVHLDQDGYALYIGCTSNIKNREANHRSHSAWYSQVVETRTVGTWTKEIALAVEKGLIRDFTPPYNGTGYDAERWDEAVADRDGKPREYVYYPRLSELRPDIWDYIVPKSLENVS